MCIYFFLLISMGNFSVLKFVRNIYKKIWLLVRWEMYLLVINFFFLGILDFKFGSNNVSNVIIGFGFKLNIGGIIIGVLFIFGFIFGLGENKFIVFGFKFEFRCCRFVFV